MKQSLIASEEPKLGKQLHVVRLVADYPVGGKASYGLQPVYYNLSRSQVEAGHEVDVIARREADQPAIERSKGVTIHRVGPPFTANAILKLRTLVKDEKACVIHTHSTSGVFLAGLKRAFKAPVVSHVHGTTYSAATPTFLEFGSVRSDYSKWRVTTSYLRERALWSTADRIAAVSSSVESDLVTRYGISRDKIRLVYNGVDHDLFNPASRAETEVKFPFEGNRIVLYVGHFGLRKGIPILLKAMRTVIQEVNDARLVCVGGIPPWLPPGPYMSFLNELIGNYGLGGKVSLLDRVSQAALPKYYLKSSVFVLPSFYEAFPKVLIEAMACGKPVIATVPGGTVDSVDHGTNGYLVPVGDSKALATRIIELLEDDQLAKRMGSEGRRRVLRDFTWQAVSNRIDLVYGEVLRV